MSQFERINGSVVVLIVFLARLKNPGFEWRSVRYGFFRVVSGSLVAFYSLEGNLLQPSFALSGEYRS